MTVFVCLDDRGGMLFNHRRQSRDREQIADMWREVGTRRLLCAPYSQTLFAEGMRQPIFDEDFLSHAEAEDCCFVENKLLSSYVSSIDTLYVYKWNRTYPRDTILDIPLPGDFRLTEMVELAGYSHEMITRERYER
ncbi:MAG: ribonuclease Z [Clostridia bacterium]|nr:ribonuclease Z [Clostridia bacterium]